ncbi:MAG TPA: hypothetical protein VKH37_01215 [Ferruginibacter sp.]|nr:hypothetical protein [Ferruginibacter sp.]
MSKLLVMFESSELTQESYDNILKEMGDKEKEQYSKRPIHMSYQNGDKFCVIDVWNSQAELEEFAASTLGPVFAQLGIAPPQPQVFPIYRYVNTP